MNKSKYLVQNTARYNAWVLNEIPRHERDVWILCSRITNDARCDRSPRKRKMFIVVSTSMNVWYRLQHPPYSTLPQARRVRCSGLVKWRCVADWIVGLLFLLPYFHAIVHISPIDTNHSISWASCMSPFPDYYPANSQVIKTQSHLARDWRDLVT